MKYCENQNVKMDILKFFISNGADCNKTHPWRDDTCLSYLCKNDNATLEMIKLLVEEGGATNFNDGFRGALEASKPNIEVLEYFISKGIDINHKFGYREET